MPAPLWLAVGPGGAEGKESACNAADSGSGLIPRSGRSPGGGHGNPLQYSCLENPHGQRSLMGYSPWGPTESDMTERPRTQVVARMERGSSDSESEGLVPAVPCAGSAA